MSTYTRRNHYTLSITVIGVLFFLFGFVTNVNDILIPHLKLACQLTDFASAFVQFAFFGAYFIMAIPAGMILRRIGYKRGIVLGLLICALGALLFIPAATSRVYVFFLIALSVLASGVTLLQTAANPYVSILGPMESAPARINIMGVCNNAAGFLAPLIFGFLLFKGVDLTAEQLAAMPAAERMSLLDSEAARVILPYLILATALVLLAFMVRYSALPEIHTEADETDGVTALAARTSVLEYPNLVFGVAAIFFYVAAEVAIGSFIIRYGSSLGIEGFSKEVGSHYVSAYWLITGVGRFLGIFTVGKLIAPNKALTFNAIAAIVLLIVSYVMTGLPALLAVVAIGLFNSIMWPVIFPLAIDGLGKFTKIGSSLLIMAIVGGAVFPPLIGLVTDLTGSIKLAYLLNIICYSYLIFYGVRGYRK